MDREMNLFCGLSYYNEAALDFLLGNPEIHGIVLGDLFCQKRMFEEGEPSFYRMLFRVGDSGKKLVYQTPVYVTEQEFEKVTRLLEFIDREYPGSIISATDIGLASFLKKHYNHILIIWNRMGHSRERYHNRDFFHFLKKSGFTAIETADPGEAERAESAGLAAWLIYGDLHYQTMGRVCYTRYQLDIDKLNCEKFCRGSEYSLRETMSGRSMALNGYLIGESLQYTESFKKKRSSQKSNTVMFYAKDVRTAKSNLHNAIELCRKIEKESL